jgi:uncharacterized protein (DUF2267 family)
MENAEAEGELRGVLLTHAKVFKGTGCCSEASEFEIKLKKGVKPLLIDQPARKRSPAKHRVERETIEKLVNESIMEPSMTPAATQNVFVEKWTHEKQGKPEISMATDFRKLNSITENDAYPLEDLHAIVEWLPTKTRSSR